MGERFVGRTRDLALLEDAAQACAGGRGQLVLVGGEPGIGKTRLAEELAARLTSRGWRIAVARCAEGGGAPAFWPWTQVLRSLIRTNGVTAGDLDVEVARLVPELGVAAPRVEDQVVAGERFALFDGLTRLLLDTAVKRPLLVVLDDLHAGDKPSLSLLQFIANELSAMRVLVVGTFRDTESTGTRLMVLMSKLTSDHQMLPLGGLHARPSPSWSATQKALTWQRCIGGPTAIHCSFERSSGCGQYLAYPQVFRPACEP